jgi:hypothetical protein
MYNGQYAKGVVHLVVFAILVSLANENGIFGLFIAGWVCYMVIEAYHTARARRDGTPLPNPFGLNELGERLGFGKAWPTASQPFTTPGDSTVPPAGTYPPPASGYPPPPSGYSPYTAPAASGSTPWNWENHVPPPQPGSPYAAPFAPMDPNAAYPVAYPRNRFPVGAIWLIVLGAIFLLGNSQMFHIFPMHWFLPFLLIGFGVWLFVRRMTEFGAPLADDGTAHYRYRVVHALHGSVWIVLVGVLFLLDSFHILSWGHSWPLFIIVAGLMAILRGMAYSHPLAPYPPPPPTAPPPPSSSIVPPSTHDQEGS